jgi:hypothetical protein
MLASVGRCLLAPQGVRDVKAGVDETTGLAVA